MLDIKFVRDNPEKVREQLAARGEVPALDELLKLDKRRRSLIEETDRLKARRNELSKEIAALAKSGGMIGPLKDESRAVGQKVSEGDEELKAIQESMRSTLLSIPNLPHESVPTGKTDADNELIREWGSPAKFDFEIPKTNFPG